jgi:hypothetical protein
MTLKFVARSVNKASRSSTAHPQEKAKNTSCPGLLPKL